MGGSVAVWIPRGVAERLEREARRLGVSLEEYVLELLLGDLDPPGRAREGGARGSTWSRPSRG